MAQVSIKRVYEDASESDGFRVLVDRLWPRGMSKERLHPDLWAKGLAPSNEARKEFAHKAENFQSFRTRYLMELDQSDEAAALAAELLSHEVVTLLYAAKDPEVNHAVILRDWLESREK
ncbi:DUF488 domain-containing protein [Olsenella phocaeensis]|uniref:DUF488 domain-containing protein n=1 Tax=Olsenella phocaeensis TaxID=1852385 RepID=UPI000930B8D3|nr:DUF488 family protein [Olsenella phocaeensis]